jgi:outer membrane protein assembly factor BamB
MRTALKFLAPLLVALPALAADWPQWRGPNRDGHSPEKGLLKTWPKGGPKLLWSTDKAGLGLAGMAVVGGNVYTMGTRGADEYLLAFDKDGKEIWATKMGPIFDFKGNVWSRGPNATPSVVGDFVYGVSSNGMLVCAKKAKGDIVWKVDMPKELQAEVNGIGGGVKNYGWGFSWSALVDGDQLVLTPGGPKGLFAAVSLKNGKPIWRSKGNVEQASYTTPAIATIAGVKQYITVTQKGIVSVSAKDGEVLWKYEREEPYSDDAVVCNTPIVEGDLVFNSVGWSSTSELLKVTKSGGKFSVKDVYKEKGMSNRVGGFVKVGDYVYGYNETQAWACQDFKKGDLKWPGRVNFPTAARVGLKSGAPLFADGRLYIVDELGQVAMVEANPKANTAISWFKLPMASKNKKASAKVWTPPSLSDGKLYVRDQEYIFCYEVKK